MTPTFHPIFIFLIFLLVGSLILVSLYTETMVCAPFATTIITTPEGSAQQYAIDSSCKFSKTKYPPQPVHPTW